MRDYKKKLGGKIRIIMSYRDPEEKNIKNDFAPNMRNEYFSINGIIHCLRHGFMQINKLPPELAKVVQEELNRIKQTNNSKDNGGSID